MSNTESTKPEEARPAGDRAKRPYHAPILREHGDLRALTLAKGSTGGDGSGKIELDPPYE